MGDNLNSNQKPYHRFNKLNCTIMTKAKANKNSIELLHDFMPHFIPLSLEIVFIVRIRMHFNWNDIYNF